MPVPHPSSAAGKERAQTSMMRAGQLSYSTWACGTGTTPPRDTQTSGGCPSFPPPPPPTFSMRILSLSWTPPSPSCRSANPSGPRPSAAPRGLHGDRKEQMRTGRPLNLTKSVSFPPRSRPHRPPGAAASSNDHLKRRPRTAADAAAAILRVTDRERGGVT